MVLPPSCQIAKVTPSDIFYFSDKNVWAPTDLTYNVQFTRNSHVIVMYQFAGGCKYSNFVMRLKIDPYV